MIIMIGRQQIWQPPITVSHTVASHMPGQAPASLPYLGLSVSRAPFKLRTTFDTHYMYVQRDLKSTAKPPFKFVAQFEIQFNSDEAEGVTTRQADYSQYKIHIARAVQQRQERTYNFMYM